MTHKEIAEIIRRGQEDELQSLADELDPPRPEPGTVVWWKFIRESEGLLRGRWRLGIVTIEGDALWTVTHDLVLLCDVETKPARILADDEAALKIPPVSEWPQGAERINFVYETDYVGTTYIGEAITRAEAEAREAGR